MVMVEGWIDGFLRRHRGRFRPGDWPDPGGPEMGEFAEGWRAVFARNGVTEAEADEASKLCAERPPDFRREHLPLVMGLVKLLRDRKGAVAGAGEYQDREAARAASKGCEHCGGNGLTAAWHPTPSHADRIPETVAAYCVCAHGRWIRRAHAISRDCRHVAVGFPDLADVLAGESVWLASPPGLEAYDDRGPSPRAAVRAMFKVPEKAATV